MMRGFWTLRFSRCLNDWEIVDVECLLVRLQVKVVNGKGEHIVIWSETKSGIFSVKSLYAVLELGNSSVPFPVGIV